MSKIKGVIIGFSHTHANEVAKYMCEQPDFELSAIADAKEPEAENLPPFRFTRAWNLENVRENYCSNVYEDYKKMLDETKPDIAFILTENSLKPEVVEECAKRGVNVCIEKPIAVSFEEAKKIEASINRYGIEAVVNWPVMWRPYVHKMVAAVKSGLLGEPKKLRYINGHTGPFGQGIFQRGVETTDEEKSYSLMSNEQRGKTWWHNKKFGGGAYLDICGYGCFYAEWFFGGGAEGVLSYGDNLNTPFGDVEDNFASIIKYPDKKMAVIEGTWSTPRKVIPSGPMLVCSGGVINCTGGAEEEPDLEAYDMFGRKVEIPEIQFDDKYKNMPWMWAHHIKTGEKVHHMLTFETNIKIMKMTDAMMRASKSGKTEEV